MKNNKKKRTIRFKTWGYLTSYAFIILFCLQFFLFILIEPFYRETIQQELTNLNTQISNILFSNSEDYEKTSSLYSLTYKNKACMVIVSKQQNFSVGFDGTADECAIYKKGEIKQEYVDMLEESNEPYISIDGKLLEVSDKEVMIYGRKITNNHSDYLILVSQPLQSLQYLTKTIQGQFTLITLVVLLLALILSIILSSIISKPLVSMTNEAKKLTNGNYDLHFDDVNILELSQLADTIDVAAEEMQKIESIRRELMANVTHDIKTPLTMIKAYTELIKDIYGDNPEKRNEYLDIINQETDSLSKLVNDMLDLSRLQSGISTINRSAFDLSKEIQNAASRFQTIAIKENVIIEVICSTELVGYGDASKINEVIYNFVSNALKHYGEDNKVIINAYPIENNHIRVEVIDHGTGISEENLPYIWDRYFKIDKQYHRCQTGSGLGLPISKAILEAHKAKYGVVSKLNEGSMFYFELEAYNDEK